MSDSYFDSSYDLLGKNPSRKSKKSASRTHENVQVEVQSVPQDQDFYILRDDSL